MSDGFYWECPQSSLPAIDVTQNLYSDLNLSQSVDRSGSEWVRSVEHDLGLVQSFSDFYHEDVTTTMNLVSGFDGDFEFNVSASNTLSLVQSNSVAGGRILTSGGGSSPTFPVTYDSGGSSAVKGQIVYVDGGDGEAKLADYTGVAEVAGFLTEDVSAGASTEIQTEGEIQRSDWTDVAGTTNLLPGAYYYLHTGGEMRVTAPASGTIVVVGRAITTTRFDAEINTPWE